MPVISLAACAQILKVPYTGENIYCTSVSIDTRTLKAGALFFALQGEKWDGHDFIEVAQKKKAVAIIGELPIKINLPYLQVENAHIALGLLAQHHRQQFSLPVIALTGSCGKTTTKSYLHNILCQSSTVLTAQKSFNNIVGVSLTLFELNQTHDFAILELGANRKGQIEQLTQLAQPTTAILLNILPAHTEGFGSIKNIVEAKTEIFKGLTVKGTAILSTDFLKLWSAYLPQHQTLFFGDDTAAVYAKHITVDNTGKASFLLKAPEGKIHITLPLPGRHQINNALAAATGALANNISLPEIKRGLETVKMVEGRLYIKESKQYGIIIDDTYNATPYAVKVALAVLAGYPKRRMLVLGDMKELGKKSQYYHHQVAKWACSVGVQKVFTYGDDAYETTRCFGKNAKHFDTQEELVVTLKNELNSQCITLIKGSRKMQMERVVEALMSIENS